MDATQPATATKEEDAVTEDLTTRRRRLVNQGVRVFLTSLGMWAIGCNIVFPSVMAYDLNLHNTTLYGTFISVSDTQLDLLSSMVYLTAPLGAFAVVPIMTRLGRRPAMMVSGILMVSAWLLIAFVPAFPGIVAGRFVSGISSGAMSLSVNSNVVEMADRDVRGIMSVIISMGVSLGSVYGMGVGYDARYYTVSLMCALVPLCFTVGLLWVPESPTFLLISGREEQARKVLRKLRGEAADLEDEIAAIRAMNNERQGAVAWRALLQPDVLKPLLTMVVIFAIHNFSGFLVINANASRIFDEAGSSIDDNLASLILVAVQLFGYMGGVALIDRIGRKKSMVLSLSIMCVSLACMAAYVGVTSQTYLMRNSSLQTKEDTQTAGWVPLVCLMVAEFSAILGVGPLPYLLMVEFFPTWIRSQATSVMTLVRSLFSVAAFQLYTPMVEGLTFAGLFAFYASVCALGIPFVVFVVKETMGTQVG